MLDSWLRPVPAYRLAAFRVVVAATSLCKFLPVLADWLLAAAASPATTATLPWLPHVPTAGVAVLLGLGFVAAGSLLVGWRPATSALYLAGLGAWGYAAGNHSHNGLLHVLLLVLVACSSERLSLSRLVREDDAGATCAGWPERLLRVQLSIVYFHTAVDKIWSPLWGLDGLRLTYLESTRALPGLAELHRWTLAALAAHAGTMSVAVIVAELALAVGLLLPPLWPALPIANAAFALALEFLLEPALFPWDLLAVTLLFLPAADRAFVARLDAGCGAYRLQRRLLAALEQHGRRLGHQRVRLDTNGTLTEAIRMYRRSGYAEIERYNDNPYAQLWFEKTLTD
ncbi:MAG: HTTM domain-containing protein [Thermoanaerobaculia bacterium]|nr:HTTM domain-containing protein [Thermoanaerobaculia bacterium]